MAQAVKARVKAVLQRARHDGASPTAVEPGDPVGNRDRLLVEMEAGCVGSVEITTFISPHDLRVEVHLSYDSEAGGDGNGAGGN